MIDAKTISWDVRGILCKASIYRDQHSSLVESVLSDIHFDMQPRVIILEEGFNLVVYERGKEIFCK